MQTPFVPLRGALLAWLIVGSLSCAARQTTTAVAAKEQNKAALRSDIACADDKPNRPTLASLSPGGYAIVAGAQSGPAAGLVERGLITLVPVSHTDSLERCRDHGFCVTVRIGSIALDMAALGATIPRANVSDSADTELWATDSYSDYAVTLLTAGYWHGGLYFYVGSVIDQRFSGRWESFGPPDGELNASGWFCAW